MNTLIVNNDLIKSANLNELKELAYQCLSSLEGADNYHSDCNEDGVDFIYKFELKIGECSHRLVIRDIDVKHLKRSEIVSRIKEKIQEEHPESVYLHLASFGHANHFKDYITVQVANQLENISNIVFFTYGPVDIDRFTAETGYPIFMQDCAGDVLRCVFNDMGIDVPLNDGGTFV